MHARGRGGGNRGAIAGLGAAGERSCPAAAAAAAIGARYKGVVSSWGLVGLSVDVLRQQVRSSWVAQRVQACLPQLQRYLVSRQPHDRNHQETTDRAWLERTPTTRSIVMDVNPAA